MSHATKLLQNVHDSSQGGQSVRTRRETVLKWPPSLEYENIMKPFSDHKILWDLFSNMDPVSRDKVVSNLSRMSGGDSFSLGGNLLFEILKSNPALLTNPHFARIILKLLSFDGNSGLDIFLGVEPKDLVDVLLVNMS